MNALSPSNPEIQAKRRLHQLGVIFSLMWIGNLLAFGLITFVFLPITTSTGGLAGWAHIAAWAVGVSIFTLSRFSARLYQGNFAVVCQIAQACASLSVIVPGIYADSLIYTPLDFIWIYLRLAPLSVHICNLLFASDWLFCIWLYRALTTGLVEQAMHRSSFAPSIRTAPAMGFLSSLCFATIFLGSSLIFPHLDGSFQVAQEAARQAELKLGDDYRYFMSLTLPKATRRQIWSGADTSLTVTAYKADSIRTVEVEWKREHSSQPYN